jgi:NAD(P)-dependent dehydrogenase (short-subunit alcohol dehydrogenase family)
MPRKEGNKTALVTGAAHRVGRVITLQLARQGYDVAVHYHRSQKDAVKTVKKIKSHGVRAFAFRADLSRVSNVKKLVRQAWQRMGPISLLVNSSAVFFRTPLGKVREGDWDRIIDTNLKGAFFLSQEMATRMKQTGNGHIIHIADVGAFQPWAGYIPYCVSKAGIVMLTHGLAKALAPKIRVNAIAPGPVLLPKSATPKQRQASIEATLLKRIGKPEDVAQTVGFLADGPDFFTGSVIPLDGGKLRR